MTPDVIERIQSGWRMHQRWQRAENALVLQGKAICRSWTDGDKVAATKLFDAFRNGEEIDQTLAMALLPFGPAIDQFVPLKKQLLKEITVLARQLPAMAWVKSMHNFGDKSFATIIGEAGDLSNYSTHSKLWRRMGMAPFAKNGVTRSGKQWKVAGGLNADDWSEFGYSGRRRSVMYVIEQCLFKGGPYREIALARKDYLRRRAESQGLKVAASDDIPKKERDQYISKDQIHKQAMHYMGKKLLRDLWQAWRRADGRMPERAKRTLPAAVHSAAPNGAGEAVVHVPATASCRLPPRKSKKAAKAAGEAISLVPEMAKSRLPPRKSKKAPAGAVAAKPSLPKGHPALAATKLKKAAKAAGRAASTLPLKANLGVPDHSSGDAL